MGDVGMGPRAGRDGEDGDPLPPLGHPRRAAHGAARVESVRSRRIEVRAHIEDAQGATVAESTALFMRFTPEEEQRMSAAMGRGEPPPKG